MREERALIKYVPQPLEGTWPDLGRPGPQHLIALIAAPLSVLSKRELSPCSASCHTLPISHATPASGNRVKGAMSCWVPSSFQDHAIAMFECVRARIAFVSELKPGQGDSLGPEVRAEDGVE